MSSRISTFHAVHGVRNLDLGELQVHDEMRFTSVKRNIYRGEISMGPSVVSNHMTCVVRVFDAGDDIRVVYAVVVVTARVTALKIESQK